MKYPGLREEFNKALRDLNTKKALGIKEIQTKFRKQTGEKIYEFFKFIKDIRAYNIGN